MKKMLNKLNDFLYIINEKNIGETTANCAYFTILAFIPLVMLILTLTKYIGLDNQVVTLTLVDTIPSNMLNDMVVNIVKEVYSKSVGTITISAIVVLWSAGKGFSALCNGLSVAYEINVKNKFVGFRLRGIACTIIFILLILLFLLLLVFGNRINIILQEKFNIFNTIINMLIKSKVLISVILLSIVFCIMYKFIPKHEYKFKSHIPGAIIASIGCNIVSIFYSIYVNLFTGFSLMYGSLTTIVLAMMWIYACMYIILIGAIINKEIIKNRLKIK